MVCRPCGGCLCGHVCTGIIISSTTIASSGETNRHWNEAATTASLCTCDEAERCSEPMGACQLRTRGECIIVRRVASCMPASTSQGRYMDGCSGVGEGAEAKMRWQQRQNCRPTLPACLPALARLGLYSSLHPPTLPTTTQRPRLAPTPALTCATMLPGTHHLSISSDWAQTWPGCGRPGTSPLCSRPTPSRATPFHRLPLLARGAH